MRLVAPPPRATAGVRLVEPDLALLDAALHDRAALARRLGCELADGWDVFHDALPAGRAAAAAAPDGARWGVRLFLVDRPPTLVGWGGFKGAPRAGVVELGYAVAPGWRGRGIATAAVRELLAEAFAAREVSAVLAHTLPAPGPSARVLERAGFARDGAASDVDEGQVWRFRLERPLAVGPA